jgi:tRNA threonylcarbamoyladenosine biosynthesis protein TsaE
MHTCDPRSIVSRIELISRSAEETLQWGREIGQRLHPPALVALSGELGAGKTTLTKGIVSGLGAAKEEEVTSPTFTLVHAYHNGARVYHVDLYRVTDFHDFETLGIEDIFADPAVVVIEWAEKVNLRTDWPVVRIHLEHVDEDSRQIAIDDSTGLLGELRTVES